MATTVSALACQDCGEHPPTLGPRCVECFARELERVNFPVVRTYAWWRLMPDVKHCDEDVAHEALGVSVVNAISWSPKIPVYATLSDLTSFRPFLIKTAGNIVRRINRRKRIENRVLGVLKALTGPDDSDEGAEVTLLRKAILHDAIQSLRAKGHDCVVLIDLMGLSYREAALVLSERYGPSFTEDTVRAVLHRAREKLPDLVRRAAVSRLPRPIPQVYQSLVETKSLEQTARALRLDQKVVSRSLALASEYLESLDIPLHQDLPRREGQ